MVSLFMYIFRKWYFHRVIIIYIHCGGGVANLPREIHSLFQFSIFNYFVLLILDTINNPSKQSIYYLEKL